MAQPGLGLDIPAIIAATATAVAAAAAQGYAASPQHLALLAHLREFFPGQYLTEGGEEAPVSEAPRLRGGGLRGGKEPIKETPRLRRRPPGH